MRHFVSVLLALVTGPLVLLLAGRGLVGLADAAQADRTDHFGLVTSGAALGLAGLVYAVLTMARLAPLGPTLTGAGYVALGWWALQDPEAYLATIQNNPALGGTAVGPTEQHLLMAAQIAPLLAVPLLVTFVMPSRWRRTLSDLDQPEEGTGEQTRAEPGRSLTTDTLDDLPRVPAGGPMPHPGAQLSPPHHLAGQQPGSHYPPQHPPQHPQRYPAQYPTSPQNPGPGQAPYSPPYSAPQSQPQPAPPYSAPQYPAPAPPSPPPTQAPLTEPPTVPQPPPAVPGGRTLHGPPGGTLHGAASEEATLPLSGEETTTNLRPGAAAPTDRA